MKGNTFFMCFPYLNTLSQTNEFKSIRSGPASLAEDSNLSGSSVFPASLYYYLNLLLLQYSVYYYFSLSRTVTWDPLCIPDTCTF